MTKFRVLVSEIQAALLFASNDDKRIAIMSVHFDLDGKNPVLVATDGRKLCVIETEAKQENESSGSFRVSADFLKPMCAFAKSQALICEIEYHPSQRVIFDLLEAHCVIDSLKGAVVDAQFPAWRQTIPQGKREPIPDIAINGALVADFAKAAKALGAEVPALMLNLAAQESGEETSIEVKIVGKPNFYGLLMPMKGVGDEKEWQPEFVGMPKTVKLDGVSVTIAVEGHEPVTVSGEAFSKVVNQK